MSTPTIILNHIRTNYNHRLIVIIITQKLLCNTYCSLKMSDTHSLVFILFIKKNVSDKYLKKHSLKIYPT